MERRGLGGPGPVNPSAMKRSDGQLTGHLTMAPAGTDMFHESDQLDLHLHVFFSMRAMALVKKSYTP